MSIQFSQLGAGNMKRRYKSSIRVEIEKINVETIALGSRKCEFGQELEKFQIAHNPFNETPKENFEVVHKVFDGMPNKNVNPTRAVYVVASSGRFSELKGHHHISSAKDYYDTFISIFTDSQLSPEHGLSCFIDGLKEEIQGMVRLFKPQTLREAYYLAKIHELTLSKTKPKDPTRTIFKSFLQFDATIDSSLKKTVNSEINSKQVGIVKYINELELNNVKEHGKVIEASMIKDKILRQPNSDFIVVSETFEWKLSLKSCSFERRRKIQHGLDKHGFVHMLRTRSLMLREELHLKYDYKLLKWHYLGRKFKSSRRLQGVIDAQP
ncbi:hypothetical protein Tco_0217579 [Tanacetum coccineum]